MADRFGPPGFGPSDPYGGQPDFEEFEAVELYCPTCKHLVSVKKYLLLVLPDGDKYEYRCDKCGTPVGDKLDKGGNQIGFITR